MEEAEQLPHGRVAVVVLECRVGILHHIKTKTHVTQVIPQTWAPPGAGRRGAHREAKRQSGIPTSQQPSRVTQNRDRRGNPQPGRNYEYVVPTSGGGKTTVNVRNDAAGHNYGPNNPQNRGPHFNDRSGNHFDYWDWNFNYGWCFKKNDVYNIRNSDLHKNKVIAASSWVSVSACRNEARSAILRLIFKRAMNKIPKHNFWCFVGNSTWQDDTKIVRHRKLWKALHARGIDISHSIVSYEEVLEDGGKLRFFGAKLFSELSIESVVNTIERERCSYLVL